MKSATIGNLAAATGSAAELRRHLFYETSHSPALADLVGYDNTKDIIDFCFIANPYYPTQGMLDDLQRNFPNLIKSYPSSSPLMSQQNLAAVLNVNPIICSLATAPPNSSRISTRRLSTASPCRSRPSANTSKS